MGAPDSRGRHNVVACRPLIVWLPVFDDYKGLPKHWRDSRSRPVDELDRDQHQVAHDARSNPHLHEVTYFDDFRLFLLKTDAFGFEYHLTGRHEIAGLVLTHQSARHAARSAG